VEQAQICDRVDFSFVRDELKDIDLLYNLIEKTVSIALGKRQAFPPLIFFEKKRPDFVIFVYLPRRKSATFSAGGRL